MKLSIITINFNNAEGLKTTLESVLQQSWQDFEYLIIDGGSSDGSKEVILQHEQRLAYWCSEKDSGVYHAMNKGILRAKGDYLLFLNSGDRLAERDVLEKVYPYLMGDGIVFGDLWFDTCDGSKLFCYPDTIDIPYLLVGSLPHPASFIRRSLFENSLYSETYRIVSDWEFWVKKIILEEVSYRHLPWPISRFAAGGISSDEHRCNQEREQVLHRLFPGQVYSALHSWAHLKRQPVYPLFEEISHTHRFQHRVRSLLRFLLKLHRLFAGKDSGKQ